MSKEMSIEKLMASINKGRVTDKETAIALLLIDPKAWDLLSPELKKDEELMLYCQPKLYVEEEGGPTCGAYEQEWARFKCDRRFVINGSIQVSCGVFFNIESMMPNFVIRKSNPFKKAYIGVQKRLEYKSIMNGDSECEPYAEKYKKIVKNMNTIYGNASYRNPGPYDGYHSDFTVYEADLSVLPEIVTEEYQKYLSIRRR